MTPIVQTLVDQIFVLVRERIVTGKLPQDVAIRQDALAAEFGVSKIPLREAFVRLEQEGLLISQINRGFFVRPMSAAEAEEVYELRLRLEPEAVAMAAMAANDDDHRRAREALQALDYAAGKSIYEIAKHNRNFHLALVRPAQKPLTMQMLERLNVIAERYISKNLEMPGRQDVSTQEHALILEAWLERRTDEAAELTRKHIATALEDLRRQFAA